MDAVGLDGGPVRAPMAEVGEGDREAVWEALKQSSVITT